MQRLLLMGTGVVHGPDVFTVQADQADRLLQPLDEQGLTLIQVVEVGDDDKSHGYFLPVARRREAGWLPRTSIQPLRVRVRITGCGWGGGARGAGAAGVGSTGFRPGRGGSGWGPRAAVGGTGPGGRSRRPGSTAIRAGGR